MQEPDSPDDRRAPFPGGNPKRKDPGEPVPIEEPEQPTNPEEDGRA
ncbi:hypothetical protein [Stutzerimonas nitrititolerans]|nr:hypothetical protein [Stutzerimonas nitrititolerans]MBA1187240.1 hypothetical protein [Stutzerimonas stutzeri]NNT94296.1 hypothetical protein [Stutzerimonas nitrititolerans]SUD83518.1 Uncharacterised protein [Stutzerimonas stutzeri]